MSECSAGDRCRVVVLFTLAGAALGVLLAMLVLTTPSDGYGKTDIGVSTALTVGTMMAGGAVGSVVCHRPAAVGLGVLLLTFLLGGAAGWLVGDSQAAGADREGREWPPVPPGRAVAYGSLAGSLVGLVVLAPRWLRRKDRPTAAG